MDAERRLDRRSVLVAGAGLLAGSLVACSSDEDRAPAGRRTTTSRPPRSAQGTTPAATTAPTTIEGSTTAPPPTTPPATTPAMGRLPSTQPWSASPGDLQPGVKLAAARLVEAIGSWPAGQGGPVHAAHRVDALGQDPRLGRPSYSPLSSAAGSAALQVIEAQYGGLLATTASVLVVCRQWHTDQTGRVVSGGTTVDVRLTQAVPHWQVTAIFPGRLPPTAQPIRPLARAVLANDRIDLPPAALADIASGEVHDSVLTAMLQLAKAYRIGVSVVRSGHPTYVFGTDRPSDHPQGRAFDTWRIDGHRVVDPSTPRALVIDYMHAAAGAGSYNVGGPVQLTGDPGQFFSDATHHDHVHAGFAN